MHRDCPQGGSFTIPGSDFCLTLHTGEKTKEAYFSIGGVETHYLSSEDAAVNPQSIH